MFTYLFTQVIFLFTFLVLDGIFIMYNYSRLCQIWAAYEKGVNENFYETIPTDMDTINFGLLTSEVKHQFFNKLNL